MATLRSHKLINCAPDAAWEVISDAAGISEWFPAIRSSVGDGKSRTVTLDNGTVLHENIVTCDSKLRRFQYCIVGGDLVVESHLGTIDAIDVGNGWSLVVYSTEIDPDGLADEFGPAIAAAVENLSNVVS